jgi:hypothetical protein
MGFDYTTSLALSEDTHYGKALDLGWAIGRAPTSSHAFW